jgi:hypothetical protein
MPERLQSVLTLQVVLSGTYRMALLFEFDVDHLLLLGHRGELPKELQSHGN